MEPAIWGGGLMLLAICLVVVSMDGSDSFSTRIGAAVLLAALFFVLFAFVHQNGRRLIRIEAELGLGTPAVEAPADG